MNNQKILSSAKILFKHKLNKTPDQVIDSIKENVRKILADINVSNNYVRIKNLEKISTSNSLEKMVIRNPNSSNPTLRRCDSIIKTHDNDDYFSLPLDKTVNSNHKIIFSEKIQYEIIKKVQK